MKNLKWLMNRLRIMSTGEIAWRIQQKILQIYEKRTIANRKVAITEDRSKGKGRGLYIDIKRISIHWENRNHEVFEKLTLLGEYDYIRYKRSWNAGFQTESSWPDASMSYDIVYGQREDIGDIRTNWELNRHYQFAALAKSYYISGESRYCEELKTLFLDWNAQNPFLYGVEWTSPMEIAIRLNSWVYTYCFLSKASEQKSVDDNREILLKLSTGITEMADYILRHRARYSSANNHLIIEMYAACLAGIICKYEPWTKQAMKILTAELKRQNFEDGVNKEMSLHYQGFIMEAYGLLMIAMEHNGIEVPSIWHSYLNKMSEFLADSCGEYGETIVFGDNDEGKILDLNGKITNYYSYVLDLMGCVLERRYTDLNHVHENIAWLVSIEKLDGCRRKERYISPGVHSYQKGGYTFIRDIDKKILIGIDHAALGFGKLAAHGHADALSFQMFVEGNPVFVDPGTYNYHVPAKSRALFRSTIYHNTVNVDGKNQSEIQGPFLWGRQADTQLLNVTVNRENVELTAQTCYEDVVHRRTYQYCGCGKEKAELDILDWVSSSKGINGEAVFLVHPDIHEIECGETQCRLKIDNYIITLHIDKGGQFKKESYYYSPVYGIRKKGTRISVCWKIKEQAEMQTTIRIEKR